jgi:cysteine synthase B
VELWAKAEWRNPGGSVKDRGAARMVLEGEKSGVFTHDKILLDATSGNTGIAYAMLGAAKGFRVRLCVPGNVTPERKRILKAFGAEVIFTDPMDGSDGAILKAKAMYAARITTPPRPSCWSRRAAASRTSSRDSARAGPSWAPAAGCAKPSPT